VTVGAVVVSVVLELLRDPGNARILFYLFAIVGIIVVLGRSRRLALLLGSLLVFGFAAHTLAHAINGDWTSGTTASGLDHVLSHWVIIPTGMVNWLGPVTYMGLIGLVLVLTLLRGWARYALLVPTLYLGTFVWENVLLAQPDATRYIVLGAMLIALMIVRPNGLFGERRVEIV
jgi:hypothetical protein